ncbi:MAG: SdrD B-like domain-containing protein, partial [Lachnospiraceae bacterium]
MKRNMSKAGKRLCNLLLVLILVMVMIPSSLWAEEEKSQTETPVSSEAESETQAESKSESETSEQMETEPSDSTDLTQSYESHQSEESESQAQSNAGSISGMLWHDQNSDGIRDDGEAGIASYPVYLYEEGDMGNAVQMVTTDGDGGYAFTDVETGVYVVGVKSNELGTDYYLLPVVSVTGDNKLGTWSDGWDEKYSDEVTIDTNSTVADLDGGMRTPPGIQPMAAYTINMSSVAAAGTGYTYASNTVTFTTAASSHTYTITGSTTTKTIIVPSGVTVNLTLSNVDIQTSTSPIRLLGSAVANITLSGTNILKCTETSSGATLGYYNAGLHVDPSAMLTIGGTNSDKLSVQGGTRGAGIGGSMISSSSAQNTAGIIDITGGTVTAIGGDYAAGIGGGANKGAGGKVTISGGTVTATSGTTTATNAYSGAGIGGGAAGDGGNITISSGTVTAVSGAGAGASGAGIGGGGGGAGGNITISGGMVTATSNSGSARDIGYGGTGSGGTIAITGGSVLPTRGASYVYNPTNGTANGNDSVGMITVTSLASLDFSFVTGGSLATYTYSGTGHAAAGYLWMSLPGVTTEAATSVSTTPAVVTAPNTVNSVASSVATLNGSFYLNNTYSVTSAYFQWGTNTSYGSTETVADSSGAITTGTYTRYANLTGLQPNTTYHYRFVIMSNG